MPEDLKSDGLFSEFFFDLICRMIPGGVVVCILIWQIDKLRDKLPMLKDESGALAVLIFFMTSWLLGCVIDIITYEISLRAWNRIKSNWNRRFQLGSEWHMGDDELDFACLMDGKPIEARRKIEKHIAESAMLRNLIFIFFATGTWIYFKECPFKSLYFFAATIVSLLAFCFLRRRANKMIALKKPIHDLTYR